MSTFWDRIAVFYDLAERINRRAVREIAVQTARRIPPGGAFLECAAGTGEISLSAASVAGSVLCTDLSLPMLNCARHKGKTLQNVAFAQRDLLHLPDSDETYDAVCAGNVLHLLDCPEQAVIELWRVTASGGVLILPTFLQGESGLLMQFLVGIYRVLGFRVKQNFTFKSYCAFFKNLGMVPEEIFMIPGRIPAGMAVFRKLSRQGQQPIDFHCGTLFPGAGPVSKEESL